MLTDCHNVLSWYYIYIIAYMLLFINFVFSLLYKNALLAHPKLHFWQLVKKIKCVSGKSLQIFLYWHFSCFEYMDVFFFVIVNLFNPKTLL